jgi:hypothetical protein
MLYSGLDLHKRTLVLSTVTADGRPVRDAKLPTTREAVRRYSRRSPARTGPSWRRPPRGMGSATCS